jgi:L-fucose isomerase-like protein
MSGPGKPRIRKFMPNRGFEGLLSSFTLKPGRVTVMRLIEDIGDYHMLFFTGEALESEPREGYFPAVRVRLDGNIDGLTANYAGQHFALCYGDQSEKITDLARILKIKAVRV